MQKDSQKTILIVDDDKETREMYGTLFSGQGFRVLKASDGVEGLDLATSNENIHLIFTGIIMPRMDGFEMIKALKDYTNTSSIPVVVNSHLGREEDRKISMELGVKDFIVRGMITPSEVLERILNCFNAGAYILKVDALEPDAQKLIEDFNLPEQFCCSNCGTDLALKLKKGRDHKFTAEIICPNCNKLY